MESTHERGGVLHPTKELTEVEPYRERRAFTKRHMLTIHTLYCIILNMKLELPV